MFRIILFWFLCREHGLGLRNAMKLKSRCSRVAFHLPFLYNLLSQRLSLTKGDNGKSLTVGVFAAEQTQHFPLRSASSPSTATQAAPKPVSCWVWLPVPAPSHTHRPLPLPKQGTKTIFWGALPPLVTLIAQPGSFRKKRL